VEKDISRMQDLRSLKSFLKDMCNQTVTPLICEVVKNLVTWNVITQCPKLKVTKYMLLV